MYSVNGDAEEVHNGDGGEGSDGDPGSDGGEGSDVADAWDCGEGSDGGEASDGDAHGPPGAGGMYCREMDGGAGTSAPWNGRGGVFLC